MAFMQASRIAPGKAMSTMLVLTEISLHMYCRRDTLDFVQTFMVLRG